MAVTRVSSRSIRRSRGAAAAARNTNRPPNNNVAAAATGTQRQGRKRGRGRPRAAHPPVIILPVPSNNYYSPNAGPEFVLERGIMDPLTTRYLFKKELKCSDVSAARRIVIPKNYAETHFPRLNEKEGVYIKMRDTDGRHIWCFKFRYWPNYHSRMYLLEYTGEFVDTHGLTMGDTIYIYKDDRTNHFVIEAQKYVPPHLNQAAAPVAAPEVMHMPAPYFPIINDDYFMGDSAAITVTFGDFPTAALTGGSLPEMPPLERVSSFGSLDFSLDDFP